MAIDYPNSPTVGQQFTVGNVTWIWDGAKWGVPTTGGSSLYLPLSGGVMSGPITLAQDPTLPMHDVTKRYADSLVNDNRIINGDMRIDQRNNGAAGTAANVYTVDRWYYGNVAGKGTWQRVASSAPGFPYALAFTSSSAYTPAAGDVFSFNQSLEGDAVSDFAFGTAGAQPVTLSFWVQSSLIGTFSGALTNYAGTRSYPFTFSIPAAATPTKIAITIPGDTGGTWVMSSNAGALSLFFDLGCGATFRGPAGVWASAFYEGVTGAVRPVSTNGASFAVTGVKLEVGSVATPFNRQSLAKSMADCQRYFQWLPFNIAYYAGIAGATVGQSFSFAVPMRTAPTINPPTPDPSLTQTVTNQNSNGWAQITSYGAMSYVNSTAVGAVSVQGFRSVTSAEL